MRILLMGFLILTVAAACDRPSLPGSGGALGDVMKDNQSDGESRKGDPESTPLPKKEK